MAECTRRGCRPRMEAEPQKSALHRVDDLPFPVGLPPPPTNGFPSEITMARKARGGRENKKQGEHLSHLTQLLDECSHDVCDRDQEDKCHKGHAESPPPQEAPCQSVEGHRCVVVAMVVGCLAHLQHAWRVRGGFAEVAARANTQQGGEQGHQGEVPHKPVIVVVIIVIAAAMVVVLGHCPNNIRPKPLCVQGDGINATMPLLLIATVNRQEIAIPVVPANAG
jgi:hypothetical protein